MHSTHFDKICTYSGLSLAAFIAPANILLVPSFGRLPRSLSILGLLESAEPSRPIGTATISIAPEKGSWRAYHHEVSSSLNHQREVGVGEKRVWNLEMRFRRLTCPFEMRDFQGLRLLLVHGKVYRYHCFPYWYWRDWWYCYWYHYGIQVGLGAHESL